MPSVKHKLRKLPLVQTTQMKAGEVSAQLMPASPKPRALICRSCRLYGMFGIFVQCREYRVPMLLVADRTVGACVPA